MKTLKTDDVELEIETTPPKGKLIVFEGVDGSGKTWVIDQLIQKYPDLFVKFPFPTFSGKEKLKGRLKRVNMTDVESVLDYHFLFLQDIIEHQELLEQKLIELKGKHILLDRYYFSTICYLKNNIRKLFPSDADFVVKWNVLKERMLYNALGHCMKPDHVILLTNNFKEKDTDLMYHSHSDLTDINSYFHEEIINYHTYLNTKLNVMKSFDWIEVEAFSTTFEMIEEYLGGHNILNISSGT